VSYHTRNVYYYIIIYKTRNVYCLVPTNINTCASLFDKNVAPETSFYFINYYSMHWFCFI